jgi:hypothetical protein
VKRHGMDQQAADDRVAAQRVHVRRRIITAAWPQLRWVWS